MNVTLQQTAQGWAFSSEAALENFVWNNLHSLLGYTPLERQYVCNGEVCDILAIMDDRSLVILELKNVEDRYLIQQLTRYYANLIEEKPFAAQINYSLPVELVALAPGYHRHNLIDRQYSKLDFRLWQFSVIEQQAIWSLQLTALDNPQIRTITIPYERPAIELDSDVPEPPPLLINWLGGYSRVEQEGILSLRRQLLSGRSNVKEMVERNRICYGSGKTRLCAELIFQPSKQRPVLFLWLPTPASSSRFARKQVIGRLRIWTDERGIAHVGHVAEGLGKMKTKEEWMQLPKEKRPRGITEGLSYKSHTPVEIETYLNLCFRDRGGVPQKSTWEILADLALDAWRL